MKITEPFTKHIIIDMFGEPLDHSHTGIVRVNDGSEDNNRKNGKKTATLHFPLSGFQRIITTYHADNPRGH